MNPALFSLRVICWGWIDGQKMGLDAQYFLHRFTPRRARSIWSKINVNKVAALIEAGRMQAPGYAQIEAAKADGRWAQAYDGARTSAVPDLHDHEERQEELWRLLAPVTESPLAACGRIAALWAAA